MKILMKNKLNLLKLFSNLVQPLLQINADQMMKNVF